jgi:hypothetical protein
LTLGITGRRRAKSRWLALAAAVGTVTLIFSSSALANTAAPLSPSTFEGGDGNMLVDTTNNTDWCNEPIATFTTGTCPTANQAPQLTTGIDLLSGKTDNAFGQGTKEDNSAVTVVTGAIPPNKNDLTRFYTASEFVGGANFLYLAWERAVNIGNANIDFEINKNKTTGFNAGTTGAITLNRTVGDLLITYDFSGSGTPTLGLRTWSGSAWGASTPLDATNSEAGVNTVPIYDPIAGQNLGIGLFGEAAINLTGAGVFPAGTCESFGSTFVKSRSSSSFTAELKDFIAPEPIHISNCGEVIIRKVTVPAGGTGFGFTSNVATNPTDTTNASFSLNDGSSKDMTNVLGGTYTVTETQPTVATYTLTSIDCSAGTLAATSTDTTTGETTFTMVPGKVLDCTYTNTKAKNSPTATSSPSVIPQDKVTVSNAFDNTGSVSAGANKVMTVSLYGAGDTSCALPAVYTKTFTVTASGDYVTDNSGVGPSPGGYTITASGVYNWEIVYNGDSRNNGFTVACGVENINVTLTSTP